MFCRKCGIKLNMDEKTCRTCGASVDNGEYCNGFWDLIGEEKKPVAAVPVPVKAPTAEAAPEKLPVREPVTAVAVSRTQDRKRNKIGIWHVLCLVLLILLLIQTGKAGRYARKYEQIQEQYASLQTLCETVETRNDELEAKIDALTGDLEQINTELTEVKEALAAQEESAEQIPEETVDAEETGETTETESENG